MWADLLSNVAAAPSERTSVLADWLRDYARRRINSRLIDQRRCITPYVVLDFGNQGLLGMQVPIEHGGKLALNHLEMAWVLRQLGGIDLTLASFVGFNNCLGIRPLLRYGGTALHDRYLPDMASGRVLGSFALTEVEAGSNPLGIAAIAQRNATGYSLSGQKLWSGSAQWAGVINVIARHHDAAGKYHGFLALCVDGNQPGLCHGEESLTLGLRGMVQNAVHFDAVQVDEKQVLGSPYAGMAVAADTMGFGRFAIAAVSVGAIWHALQLMVRYAGRREISNVRLYENDHVQSVIVETWLAASALDRMVECIAQSLDGGIPPPVEVYAAAKLLSSELLWQAADAAMQMLGGRGYCDNNPAGQLLRDARITRIFEGPSETLANYLGQRLWQGSPAYLEHLTTQGCGQAAQLQQEVQTLRQRYPSGTTVDHVSSRQLIALGEVSAWTLLAAYAGELDPLSGWLKRKQQIAAARLREPAWACLPEADTLAAFIANQIGLTQQTLAGEQVQLDPYLHD